MAEVIKKMAALDYGYKDGYNRQKYNMLPTIIHYVEKGPYVELTRRGKPVAVLLSIQEYERLSRKYTGFWSAISEFRRKIKGPELEALGCEQFLLPYKVSG